MIFSRFVTFKPKFPTDRKVLNQWSQYIFDQLLIMVISGLGSEDLEKILAFSTPGFYLDLIKIIAIYAFDFRLQLFTHLVYKYEFWIFT